MQLLIENAIKHNSMSKKSPLVIDIFIDDKQIDKMSFNLHNYAYEEIIELAQHIRNNDFILRAVDTALAGDIE